MTSPYRVEALAAQDRSGFSCGSEPLDRYFAEQVTQDMRRRVTACFVALAAETGQVAAYYTLAAGSILLAELPDGTVKRLPRYPAVPVARLGRLAVDTRHKAQRLGAALLWDAATRAARSEVAVFALVVDAKDASAAGFYRHHGFLALQDGPVMARLFLPLAKLAGFASASACL